MWIHAVIEAIVTALAVMAKMAKATLVMVEVEVIAMATAATVAAVERATVVAATATELACMGDLLIEMSCQYVGRL